jgi:hypothetical protein
MKNVLAVVFTLFVLGGVSFTPFKMEADAQIIINPDSAVWYNFVTPDRTGCETGGNEVCHLL